MQCCMPLCENTSENFSKCGRITFHGFPSEEDLRAAWLTAVGKQDSQLPDSAVVCSQHFLLDDICETVCGSRQLCTGAVPSTVLVCMICLNTDTNMSPISQYKLEEAYEKLTGYPLWDGGNLKQTLCVQCAQQLRNFSRFREQSLRARSLMMELLEKHELITLQHIKMIQHANNKLRNNFVSMMLGPDSCGMYILGKSDVNRQTGSEDTVHGVTVKTECTEDSHWEDENTREIKEENADCVGEEFDEDLIKYENTAFSCTVCCEEFPHEHAYSAHVRTHRHDARPAAPSAHTAGANIKVESSRQSLLTISPVDSLNACTACEVAQYSAASEDEVPATHNEPAASVLGETEPGTSGHSSRTRTFTCNFCERVFTRKKQLVGHMKRHTDKMCYPCKMCSYIFAYKSQLVIHMRKHTGEKPYSCDVCGYKFSEKSNLVKHMKTHTDEKPYSCKICRYKCAKKGALSSHMRTHTGEKPFCCKICSSRFAHNSALLTHMRIHTGERPYSCNICGLKFTQKGHLTQHLRIHHTGEKLYCCKFCSYRFADVSHFVTHMRTHTGEKPYSCEACSYKCTRKSILVKHMKKHTG